MGKNSLSANVPATVQKFFENPPLLKSEDQQIYQALRRAITDEIRPTSVVEWLLTSDIVHHSWEINRLRRFKTHLIELKRDRFRGHDDRFRVEGASLDEIGSAQAFGFALERYGDADALLASAEQRRAHAMHEIDLRREVQVRRQNVVSPKLIEAPKSERPPRRSTDDAGPIRLARS